MAQFDINVKHTPLKFIMTQPPKQRERLLLAISRLPSGDVAKKVGSQSMYRLRVGDYRVIFDMDRKNMRITVLEIGNRGDVYK